MRGMQSSIMTDNLRMMDTGSLPSKVEPPVGRRLGDLEIELRELSRTEVGKCTWNMDHSRMSNKRTRIVSFELNHTC